MTFFFNFMARGLYVATRVIFSMGATLLQYLRDVGWKIISIGSIEPQFYAELRKRVGLTDKYFDQQHEAVGWPDLKENKQRF